MISRSRIHVILWLILFGIQFGFSTNILPIKQAMLGSIFNISVLMIVFYGNSTFLFPRYFNLENNLRYFSYAFLIIFVVASIQQQLDLMHIKKYAIELPPQRPELRFVFVFFRNFFWLWLVTLVSIVFLMQERIQVEVLQAQKMKEEKLNSELELLKAQINPHFIFNALNNIYSLAYSQSEKAPDSILKLSQMLRYVLEDCTQDRVKIKSEIEYIQNFISFQQMKSPGVQNIKFDIEDVTRDHQIAPMLFIPFIENGFKYSKIEEDEDAYMSIRLASDDKAIRFEVQNSKPESNHIKPGVGMGIENVKQRLEIVYPDRYELTIADNLQEFTVRLRIVML